MRNEKLYAVIRAAFFAALDYVFAMFQIHVPSPVGHPFVDIGFSFVALGTLFLGFKYGFISGAIGLGLFDLLNGYANHAYLTVMEVLFLTAAVSVTYKLLNKDTGLGVPALITIGLVSGIVKMLTGYLRYLIESLVDAGLPFGKAAVTALAAFPADFATGFVMFFAVPVFFVVMSRVTSRMNLSVQRH
ncbi:integral membrane protein [Ligilactobacillus ruminis DPC 6832]|uniref:Integral membrane protein n=1 Tax=Ligilactobacillus ruminis DPC 6832 TaxID=1402208 RepID=A0A837DU23_9LACO|nr:ECF transporter S component [Ligilactobacillus ruminis]KIC04389.1 integral membrane protein [Ligilactobacillus ruminis DPC 6832]